MTTWEDLRDEYEEWIIGPLWLAEIERAVASTVRRYNPDTYSETGVWDDAARENLVQEVTATQLLEALQLKYIVDTVANLSHARALLHLSVRRQISLTRRRTIVDNLLDRIEKIRPFPTTPRGPTVADSVLFAAAAAVMNLPRVRIINSDRAPIVFDASTLERVVGIVVDLVGTSCSRNDMSRVLERALTDYVPTILVLDDGGHDEPDRSFTPAEETIVNDVMTYLRTLPEATMQLLALKMADHSDTVVARHFSISRPTAAKRFKEASATLNAALRPLDDRLQNEVVTQLGAFLLNKHLPEISDGSAP
ncbi:hypothetical protein GCM10023153_31460 [Ornithinibacter aureus]|uniref:Sigma-70 family RNA polymerase sigma factor n=1 Tax=Ornithinibacter aureus TaxID=622664 RepID=A0ABP8K8K1_9MICO|nr:hypothetical protein [Ornithinibacter aureus]KAF0833909.1 hypothetical protein C8E84_1712 [Ornithinibacter aureus]